MNSQGRATRPIVANVKWRASLLIVALLTAAVAGCAGMTLPKSLQQSDVTEKLVPQPT